MRTSHYRNVPVQGQRVFYREAGPADGAAVVLLHGFPTSLFMFRNLIPLLADRYHVIAPDHLGFGLSDAPTVDEFDYTFDALADLTADLLKQLGVVRFALYVPDYGAPVGWRVALADPPAVAAVITQNGNGYEVGFAEEFWKPVREYWREQTLQTAAAVRPDIRQTSRHLVVRSSVVHSGDRVVADTTAPLALYESGFAPRWYVPRADVDVSALTPVEGQSFCPYKGLASYYDVGGARRAAWSYEDAWTEVRPISGLVSFEPDKVDVHLDGALLQLEPGQSVISHGIDRDLTVDEMTKRTQP